MAVELVTDNNFEEVIKDNDKVVVKYYASWCGACKLFAPKYKRLSNDEENQGIVFIEVDAENNEVARKAAGVNSLPYMAIFKNGELQEGKATSKEEAVVEMLNALKN